MTKIDTFLKLKHNPKHFLLTKKEAPASKFTLSGSTRMPT